jgi:hypothetical protein
VTHATKADERPQAHDEPRWCRFKLHQVIFECELDTDRPGQTRPRRCLSREERCLNKFKCVFAGGNGDPFHGSI